MLHKDYLEKHNRALFNLLLTQGKLYQHCADVENQAKTKSRLKPARYITNYIKLSCEEMKKE